MTRPLHEVIDEHARDRGDTIAIGAEGDSITYEALGRRTQDLAGWLERHHGIGRGDRVAILAQNDARTFELLIACSRLGAAIVPLNNRLSDVELASVLARCEPSVLFVDDAHDGRAAAWNGPRRALRDLGSKSGDRGETGSLDRKAVGSLEDTLVILFTSGTTGKPKGAMLSQRNVAANAASTARAWGLTHDDVALIDAPLFHTGGLNVLATPLFYLGGRVVVAPRFEAKASAETLIREGCTVAFGVPTMIERLLAEGVLDRSRVRLFVTGGAPCPHTLLDAFDKRGVTLVQGFGMTECGPNCFRPLEGGAPGSIGVPTYDLEARLVAEDGNDVIEGEPGELLLRGPARFVGYFRDEDATRAAIDEDGWLHTGDVLRATVDGWFVAGRKKEMFISGGENVYPAEVEAAIMHHPRVAEAAVVSVPDAKWGEAGVAFVLVYGDPPVSPAELRGFLRERLAGYKVPRTIHVEPDLPRTASAKIDKQALRARAAG